MLLNILKRFQN